MSAEPHVRRNARSVIRNGRRIARLEGSSEPGKMPTATKTAIDPRTGPRTGQGRSPGRDLVTEIASENGTVIVGTVRAAHDGETVENDAEETGHAHPETPKIGAEQKSPRNNYRRRSSKGLNGMPLLISYARVMAIPRKLPKLKLMKHSHPRRVGSRRPLLFNRSAGTRPRQQSKARGYQN